MPNSTLILDLFLSFRNSKVAYFHVSWTEKTWDWFRCKWEKEYIFLLLFSLAFSTLLLKYLMLIRSFYQDPVLLFCYICSLLTYLYWFHCLTEEYQDRRTYWVWRYECDGNNFHSYLSRVVKVIGSYKLISLLNRMDVFLAEVKKPPAPVGKLNQFQVCVCSKYFLFGGEGWESGLFDSKPSIAQLTPTRSC